MRKRTLASILAQIAELQVEADAIRQKERPEVLARLKGLIADFGIRIEDLGEAPSARRKSKSVAMKGGLPALYRHPVTGATWSGRGRAPGWLNDAPDRDRFLIKAEPQPKERAKLAAAPTPPKTKGATPKAAAKSSASARGGTTQARAKGARRA